MGIIRAMFRTIVARYLSGERRITSICERVCSYRGHFHPIYRLGDQLTHLVPFRSQPIPTIDS
jgi:hypothetical protein